MPDQCASRTKTGARCRRPAADGQELCGLHARGDHTALTDELADRLTDMLRAGNSVVAATAAVGISRQAFGYWMRRGERGEEPYQDFRDRVEKARAEAEVRHVTQIAVAAGRDWRAGAWILDRQIGKDLEPVKPPDTDELTAAAAAQAREEALHTLAAIGETPVLSAGAIDRYAAAVAAWRVLEHQWTDLGRPGTTLGGATGQAHVPHPLVSQIAVARREAAQLGSMLGLDPRGRQKLSRRVGAGRPPGAASAPDRAAPPRRTLRSVS